MKEWRPSTPNRPDLVITSVGVLVAEEEVFNMNVIFLIVPLIVVIGAALFIFIDIRSSGRKGI